MLSIKSKSGFISLEPDVLIFDENKKPFYFRKNVKGVFNLPSGIYYTNNTLKKTKPNKYKVRKLPSRERIRPKRKLSFSFEDNPNKCQINTHTGEIFIDPVFWNSLNRCERNAVMFHELGHFLYSTEIYCDLYATREMIKKGFNPSQIAIAFENTLDNSRNSKRQKEVRLKHLNNSYVK